MASLNQFRLYELGAKLHALFAGQSQQHAADLFVPLTDAQKILDALIKGDPFELTTARTDGVRLLTAISSLFDKHFIDQTSRQLRFPAAETPVDAQDMLLLKTYLDRFEQSLAAQLLRQTSYLAERRGIYSMSELMENATGALPKHLQAYVPLSAQMELNEGGKALGFGLGTAAAIHILRAVEIVCQKYYECFASPITAKTERHFATYLKKLQALAEDNDGDRPDERLVSILVQMKDRYRNPLMQPEQAVEVDDATMLFGLATGAIAQMTEVIRARQAGGDKGSGREFKSGATPALEAILKDKDKDDDEDTYSFKSSQQAG